MPARSAVAAAGALSLVHLGFVLALCWSSACLPRPSAPRSPEIASGTVTFRYRDPSAQVVQVAGSWATNLALRGRDWTSGTRVGLMERDEEGLWTLQVDLGPGRYEYLFLVDGHFWMLDPSNPQRVADDQGSFVSLLVVP
ncbi:MAG TPA: glycogen-binding domain-containing protein [Candidatus Krumholzibacteria bacterium]|nr:glycogen-binding domain-containing protein [Candidatus Krumholzibacteria bacterium]